MTVWQRPEQPAAQQRKSTPIAEKESDRGLEGYQGACEVNQAWRIHNITMAGRADPEVSCEEVFEPQEWDTLSTRQHHGHPSPTPPPLREMVRGLAPLGGFFARQGDGKPGIKAIWQGYQRLHEVI